MIHSFTHLLQLGCATCMADRNGVTQKAANLGIWMMLAALMCVFIGLGLVVLNFARRSRRARLGSQP